MLQESVHYEEEINTLSSYYRLDGVKDEAMGHFLLFYHFECRYEALCPLPSRIRQ